MWVFVKLRGWAFPYACIECWSPWLCFSQGRLPGYWLWLVEDGLGYIFTDKKVGDGSSTIIEYQNKIESNPMSASRCVTPRNTSQLV